MRSPPSGWLTRVLLVLIATAASGCAAGRTTFPPGVPVVAPEPVRAFLSHGDGVREVTLGAIARRAATAPVVLLGEIHDNPEHHRLQALLLEALVRAGRRPALVMEMFPRTRKEQLRRAQRTDSPASFATAVSWSELGWPDLEVYEPLFGAALRFGLVIHPGNIAPVEVRSLMSGHLKAVELPVLEQESRLPGPEARSDLRAEITEAHCGHVDEGAILERMIEVQLARDAFMAQQLRRHAGEDGAVLIAGNGHVRRDRGVPWHLQEAADGPIRPFVVRMTQVGSEVWPPDVSELDPELADAVLATSRVPGPDPCERFRESLDKMPNDPAGSP